MEVSLRWLLNQKEYGKLHCVSKEVDIERPITGVHIVKDFSGLEWLEEGDFLLTAGSLHKNDIQGILEGIQNISDKKCSGIGLNMKHLYNDFFEDTIAKANELKLPIIAIADDLPLAEISSLINREIFINTPESMESIYKEYSRLSKMIIEEKDLSSIIDVLSEQLDKQIILTDENWNIYLRDYSRRKTYRLTFDKQLWDLCNLEDLKLFSQNENLRVANVFVNLDDIEINCIVWKLIVNAEILGYLIVPEERGSLTTLQYALVENLLSLLSFSFYKTRHIENLVGAHNNDTGYDFVNNFLLKDFDNIADIKSRSDLYGFDFSRNRICIILKLKEENKSNEEKHRIVKNLWNKYCIKSDFRTYITRYLDNIIVFMLDQQNKNEKERYEVGKLLIKNIFNELLELDIIINVGVSNYCTGYLSITRAFKQQETIYIGSRVEPEKKLFFYNDYILYYILMRGMSQAELEEIYEESWKVIDEYDEKNHINFAETLESYLHCNMNAAETAEKLFIHRNTVLYRMEKIADLLKVKKFDGQLNLFLLIGLAAKRILFKVMK